MRRDALALRQSPGDRRALPSSRLAATRLNRATGHAPSMLSSRGGCTTPAPRTARVEIKPLFLFKGARSSRIEKFPKPGNCFPCVNRKAIFLSKGMDSKVQRIVPKRHFSRNSISQKGWIPKPKHCFPGECFPGLVPEIVFTAQKNKITK